MTAAERLDLDAIRARIDRAHDKVSALCSGKERWVMHIPAQPDHDADLVIGAALRDADALLRHVLDPCHELRIAVIAALTASDAAAHADAHASITEEALMDRLDLEALQAWDALRRLVGMDEA